MAKLKSEDVEAALAKWLGEGGLIDVSRDSKNGRITGWVMHPSFKGVSRADHQSWLWEGYGDEGSLTRWQGLRGTFQERASQIGLLLTFSPAEYENAFGKSAQSA